MKTLLTVLLFLSSNLLVAQNLINEQFNNSSFPPSGWTISSHSANWSYSATNNFNGSQVGECKLDGLPDFYDTTRFISPVIDLSTIQNPYISFDYLFAFSSSIPGTGSIGVATRSGNGPWHILWDKNLTATIPPSQKVLAINNVDSNATDFQFCFYFQGFSYIVTAYYIDNISLYNYNNNDVSVSELLNYHIISPASSFKAKAVVKNVGINTETFKLICNIRDSVDNILFSDTNFVSNLQANATDTIEFGAYTLANPNAYYKLEVFTSLNTDINKTNDTLQKNIYTYTHPRDYVLLEIATGTWCWLCPSAAEAVEDLLSNGRNIAVVEYHGGDSYTTNTSQKRIDYYGISGYPTTIFDGVEESIGGDTLSLYPLYVPLVDKRAAINTGLKIDLSGTNNGDDYTIDVTLNKVGPIIDTNTVLFLEVTESDISHNWQNQSKLHYVQRLMLPNINGKKVDLVNNTSINQSFQFQKESTWNANNMEVVVFVQNRTTKEVLNSYRKKLSKVVGFKDIEATNQLINLNVYPNPVEDILYIQLENSIQINSICIYDMLGNSLYSEQTSNTKINTSNFPNGVLMIKFETSKGTVWKRIIKI